MEIISKSEFDTLCAHNNTIKFYSNGYPKIIDVADDVIIKVFFPKRKMFSSDKLKPRAQRFYDNCLALATLDINAPQVLKIQHCSDIDAHLLYYRKIAGHDVRDLVVKGDQNHLPKVLTLVAELHQKGVFFGAIHLENLLCTTENQLALVDVVDLNIKKRALNVIVRYRNLRHLLLNNPIDRQLWHSLGFEKCLQIYLEAARLPLLQAKLLTLLLQRKIKQI